jgi:TonB family protein
MRFAVIAGAACVASAIVAAQGTDVPVRAGTASVSHPRIVQISSPFYPQIAQTARVQGDVIIDVTGYVAATTVTRSIPLLDAAAVNAVRTWEFEPPRANGRPVRVATTITLRVELFDPLVPLPLGESRSSISGMPADFAVVYEPTCHTMTILTPARHDLEPVYRAFSAAGLLVRAEGLRVWVDPLHSTARVSDNGVEMAIAGEAPRVDCASAPASPVCRLKVRSDGKWRQLWPPLNPSLLPPDYATQVGPTLALVKRIVDAQ